MPKAKSANKTKQARKKRKPKQPKVEAPPPGKLAHSEASPAVLPDHPTTRKLRQQNMLQLQRRYGNAYVQRLRAMASGRQRSDLIQREPPADKTKAADKFTSTYLSFGKPFDAKYEPKGPVPKKGEFTITLKVFIKWQDLTRKYRRKKSFKGYKFTKEDLADISWKDDEKKDFAANFKSSAEPAWRGKYNFRLKESGFKEYLTGVDVKVNVLNDPSKEEAGDASSAHTTITALKVPKKAPRFRSFVRGDEATLDIRDMTVPEKHDAGDEKAYIRQVGPFGFDKDVITSDLEGQIKTIAGEVRHWQSADPTVSKYFLLSDKFVLEFTGRASSQGKKAYNKELGLKRAKVVEQKMADELGRSDVPKSHSRANTKGEEHTSGEEKFRRVDVYVWDVEKAFKDSDKVEQNVAAHEAGHMFGLGDEYEEEKPSDKDVEPKFEGDKPSGHYEKVKKLMGTAAADELLVQDSASIMSLGSEVKMGHYVFFLERLNNMTGKKWKIEK